MLIQIVDKQRRAVSTVKTALLGAGITGRSVCVTADSWLGEYGRHENYAVFISASNGVNAEPFYETGNSIIECVRKTIDSIKGRGNDTKTDNQSEIAPF